jgi:hypothetical protein
MARVESGAERSTIELYSTGDSSRVLPYPAGVVPPQARLLDEQRLADVQAGAAGGVGDVLVDRDGAVDEAQELVGIGAQRAAFAAGDRHVQAAQEVVQRGAEVDLGGTGADGFGGAVHREQTRGHAIAYSNIDAAESPWSIAQ